MTKLQLRAFLFQLLCFGILFIGFRFLIGKYANLSGIWIPLTAFVVGTLLSPQFQAVKTNEGEKLFMKWIFMKGVKVIK
jgi:pilus assembly protein TadC